MCPHPVGTFLALNNVPARTPVSSFDTFYSLVGSVEVDPFPYHYFTRVLSVALFAYLKIKKKIAVVNILLLARIQLAQPPNNSMGTGFAHARRPTELHEDPARFDLAVYLPNQVAKHQGDVLASFYGFDALTMRVTVLQKSEKQLHLAGANFIAHDVHADRRIAVTLPAGGLTIAVSALAHCASASLISRS